MVYIFAYDNLSFLTRACCIWYTQYFSFVKWIPICVRMLVVSIYIVHTYGGQDFKNPNLTNRKFNYGNSLFYLLVNLNFYENGQTILPLASAISLFKSLYACQFLKRMFKTVLWWASRFMCCKRSKTFWRYKCCF